MNLNNVKLVKLDLRGTPCPLNFIRCRLALESLGNQEKLQVDLDVGEPELLVIPGLENEGHPVEIIYKDQQLVRLLVEKIVI